MEDPVLVLEDARLTLDGNAGAVDILHGISLTVRRGETVALTGPSGSGKSSLLMLMGGLERATGGQVLALGRDLTAMNEDQLARFRREHMGVVFQSFHLIPTMTALENVATPLELAGHADAFDRAEAELEAMGLGTRKQHYPSADVGRRTAARRPGPRRRDAARDPACGRTHRQPRRRDGRGDHAPPDRPARPPRRDACPRHPRAELAARCDREIRLRDGRIDEDALREAAE
jgi:putative ABC transport system ATP-binding protein